MLRYVAIALVLGLAAVQAEASDRARIYLDLDRGGLYGFGIDYRSGWSGDRRYPDRYYVDRYYPDRYYVERPYYGRYYGDRHRYRYDARRHGYRDGYRDGYRSAHRHYRHDDRRYRRYDRD